jgi:uncharacterized OsmC-like protein
MTQTTQPTIVNGVDCAALGATIEAIENKPELARFQFRAENEWMTGGHNRSTIQGFHGAGEEHACRTQPFVFDAGEPPVLLGRDEGANPVEFLLHSLAACMTTSMAYHAAARGIEVGAIESKVEGDLDLRGFLGMTGEVRKGYQQIRIAFQVKSDAEAEQLKQCATMSPVWESLTRGVPVMVEVCVAPRKEK